jgi:hypothetical protein
MVRNELLVGALPFEPIQQQAPYLIGRAEVHHAPAVRRVFELNGTPRQCASNDEYDAQTAKCPLRGIVRPEGICDRLQIGDNLTHVIKRTSDLIWDNHDTLQLSGYIAVQHG